MIYLRIHSPLLDRLVLRLFTSPFGLHLFFSAFTALATFGSLVATWNLVQACRLPSILKEEARTEEAPLVDRINWSWNRDHTLFKCYVQIPGEVLPCIALADPGPAKTLKIYRHELLGRGNHRLARGVVVPEDGSWSNIFRSAEGESPRSRVIFLAVCWAFTGFFIYVSFRGYTLLRHGGRHPDRRRHRY